MLIEIAVTSVAGLAGLLVFIYFLRKGQFEDNEEVKYQLFHHDDETDEMQ